VYVSGTGKRSNEIYVSDRKSETTVFVPIIEGIDAEFNIKAHRDLLFINTNHKAPNRKLMSIPIREAFESGNINDSDVIIPETEHVFNGYRITGDYIFVEHLENVHSVLSQHSLDGDLIKMIDLGELGTITSFRAEDEGKEFFFGFTSFTTPSKVFHYDIHTSGTVLYNEIDIGIDSSDYVNEQVWFVSKDNTQVPMFLVYKKDLIKDGKRPVLLYGYGGFNINTQPGFRASAIPIIENGGIYAVVNLRGGNEFGEDWHEAGRRDKKQNVFDDFICGAEWLFKNNYTSPKHLGIFGWSNGGLLTATVMVQRPDLAKVVIIGAPVIDMMKFHKYPDSGKHWVDEYGNPDDLEDKKFLLKYSPYHNVKEKTKYPATLVITADKDDRVFPAHSFKFTALLNKNNSSNEPILLRLEKKAGHSSSPAVSRKVAMEADMLAFIFEQLNL